MERFHRPSGVPISGLNPWEDPKGTDTPEVNPLLPDFLAAHFGVQIVDTTGTGTVHSEATVAQNLPGEELVWAEGRLEQLELWDDDLLIVQTYVEEFLNEPAGKTVILDICERGRKHVRQSRKEIETSFPELGRGQRSTTMTDETLAARRGWAEGRIRESVSHANYMMLVLNVTRILCCDREARAALMEFSEGRVRSLVRGAAKYKNSLRQ